MSEAGQLAIVLSHLGHVDHLVLHEGSQRQSDWVGGSASRPRLITVYTATRPLAALVSPGLLRPY